MIESATARIRGVDPGGQRLAAEFHEADIRGGLTHVDADLTIAVFTLQFLPPRDRVSVLADLRRRAAPEGVLLLAEKTIPADPRWALITAESSWEDKRIAGFPGDEIVAKAESLRGVLRPRLESACEQEPVSAGWVAPCVLWAEWNWRLYGYFASGG